MRWWPDSLTPAINREKVHTGGVKTFLWSVVMPVPPPPPPPLAPPPPGAPPLPSAHVELPKQNTDELTGRNALLSDIHKGVRLKKVTQINDRSAPVIDKPKNGCGAGAVVGASTQPAVGGGLFQEGFPVLRPAGQRDASERGSKPAVQTFGMKVPPSRHSVQNESARNERNAFKQPECPEPFDLSKGQKTVQNHLIIIEVPPALPPKLPSFSNKPSLSSISPPPPPPPPPLPPPPPPPFPAYRYPGSSSSSGQMSYGTQLAGREGLGRSGVHSNGGKPAPPPLPPVRSSSTELTSRSQHTPGLTRTSLHSVPPPPPPAPLIPPPPLPLKVRQGALITQSPIYDDFESKYNFHSVEDLPPPDEYKSFPRIYPSKQPRVSNKTHLATTPLR
ncbi:hypothetical protein chiPu_0003536 [Chiloscyllium punctatum]|uniref:WH2 domain-containing protein n=1 Tax=Chiloscyllium punctatum TaxID=137246 RepID=A0A401S428_CHIPU|nr:hypothetical protein [Chiloscyllium punctatum]